MTTARRCNLRPMPWIRAGMLVGMTGLSLLTACNPTWTKDGTPNGSSMPVPPDATAPRHADAGSAAAAPAAKP